MKTYVSDRKWVVLKRFPTYYDCQPGRLHGFPVSIRRILIPPQLTARRTCVSNSLMLRHSSRCRRLTAQEPVQPWSSSTSKKHTRAFTMCYSTLLSHAEVPHSFHLMLCAYFDGAAQDHNIHTIGSGSSQHTSRSVTNLRPLTYTLTTNLTACLSKQSSVYGGKAEEIAAMGHRTNSLNISSS